MSNMPGVRSIITMVSSGTWFSHCLLKLAPICQYSRATGMAKRYVLSLPSLVFLQSHLAIHKPTAHYSDNE